MRSSVVNEDLKRERQKCSFNPVELTYLIDGGKQNTEKRRAREQTYLSDPELKSKVPVIYLSHKEKYEEAVRKASVVIRKVRQLHKEGKEDLHDIGHILGGQLGTAILHDSNPLGLHYAMFIPTILGQASPEQQAEWMGKAWNLEILGTYAQTELGHGTNVRALETTATYDPKTEEFIINTPTLTAYKWWPGSLAHTANHAIVLAQLYIKGIRYGIHPFIVQIRQLDTHMPMPNIKVGEIGAKIGMNTANNGYLCLDNVRIPRKQMLMKNSKVLSDGTYVKSPNSKLTYGTMMFIRVLIAQDAANYLKKAATIAIRYSAVRRQSQIKEGAAEPQILDFVTQQYKLFPQLANYFAFNYSGVWLWEMYTTVTSELESGQMDRLPELHALSCCLKAVSAADVTQGVETCRLACGGHGYMSCSNLPVTYGLVTAMITYEGENTVLYLQTARFLMKAWRNYLDGHPLTPTVQYLRETRNAVRGVYQKSVPWIISSMQRIATGKIELAHRHLDYRVKGGLDYDYAWNETSIELVQAAEAHCRAVIVDIYWKRVNQISRSVSLELAKVLTQLCELFAVYTILNCSGDLLRFCNVTSDDLEGLQRWLEDTLAAIRPNAIGIVDGFDLSDAVVNSPLGAYDGNVYERLFEEASKSPLNAEPVNKSFHQYLKPLLQSKI